MKIFIHGRGPAPRWLRRCFTNSMPMSVFFFQNLMWPSQLAEMMKSVLIFHVTSRPGGDGAYLVATMCVTVSRWL